jgi:hypothetical protein
MVEDRSQLEEHLIPIVIAALKAAEARRKAGFHGPEGIIERLSEEQEYAKEVENGER